MEVGAADLVDALEVRSERCRVDLVHDYQYRPFAPVAVGMTRRYPDERENNANRRRCAGAPTAVAAARALSRNDSRLSRSTISRTRSCEPWSWASSLRRNDTCLSARNVRN